MDLLLTGGSGFVGRTILPLLKTHYSLKTLGISEHDDYTVDLSKCVPNFKEEFELVLHASGKALSEARSLEESEEFFKINLEGTKNLCKALEQTKLPRSFVFISTIAVYGLESGENIDESHPLLGSSPYAKSKILAEQFLNNWGKKNNVTVGILRLSPIAGKNPGGNLGAMIHGIKTGKYFSIGDGSTRKSILMAEDIANLFPKLIKRGGIYNACDNHHPSFAELEYLIASQLNKKKPGSIPYWVAKTFAAIGDILGSSAPINSAKLQKITNTVTFSNEKAKRDLGWKPLDVLQNFKIT